MKNNSLKSSVYKFITLSLHYGRKLSNLRAFVFTVRKELQLKNITIECAYSVLHDKHHENSFAITSGNSLTMMNLLIQWMTWNYMVRHRFLTSWKLLRQSLGRKLQEDSGKAIKKSTGHSR